MLSPFRYKRFCSSATRVASTILDNEQASIDPVYFRFYYTMDCFFMMTFSIVNTIF